MALGRAFATVGGLTMISRIFGLVREILIAAFLGAGAVADAFYAAFRFPNMFRRFFAEGAFSMAFVPMFTKRLGQNREDATAFGSEALALLGGALILFTVLATLLMPWLIYLLAAGFADTPDKKDLAVLLARLCFPYLLLISLVAFYSAVLNATGRFVAAAGAPILLNLFMIGGMLLAVNMGWPVAPALAISVTLGGLGQLLLLWFAARRAGISFCPGRPRLTPDMRRMLSIAAPAALSGGVLQVNLLIGTSVASFFDGAVTWLTIADRVYQLPLGAIGVAIGVVLLPELSRRAGQADSAGANVSMNRSLEFALLLTLPATTALLVMPREIVSVLFQRGAFSASDSGMAALALRLFALGLPAYVLNKALTAAYLAREDTRTPFRFALIAMLVNSLIAVLGALTIGWQGVPLGTAVAAWINIALLMGGLRGSYRIDEQLSHRLPRMVLASGLMGLAVFGLAQLLGPWLYAPGWRYGAFLGVVVSGMLIYGACATLLKAVSLRDLKAGLQRHGGHGG